MRIYNFSEINRQALKAVSYYELKSNQNKTTEKNDEEPRTSGFVTMNHIASDAWLRTIILKKAA